MVRGYRVKLSQLSDNTTTQRHDMVREKKSIAIKNNDSRSFGTIDPVEPM
jgi:hypothetical protein